MSCPSCGSARGLNLYCWYCGEKMPYISEEDLLRFDMRRSRQGAKYGRSVSVKELLKGGEDKK